MPKFAWEGRTRDGQVRTGVIESDSLIDVETKLRALQVTPIKIRQKRLRDITFRFPSLGGIKTKTLVVFVRQLSTMIDAGLPLVQCLDILAAQEPDLRFKAIILNVKLQVEAGSTFANALTKHPKVFDPLFTNLVAAGEVGGILDSILNRLALYLEKAMRLRAKVRAAMKYPLFVLTVAIGITTFLLWKVIPTFAVMFKNIGGAELPALTQFVINLSNNFLAILPLLVISVVLLVIGFISFYKSANGRRMVDGLLLRIPIIGLILRKAAIARFTRTLATLLSSGVPILDSLEIVAKSAGNKVIENGLMFAKASVAEGKSIATPLDEVGIFPKMVVQMINVGESTGAIDIMLTKIADFYDDEVDASVESITALIEPAIMLVIGGLVGFVLVAMYLPIFTMAENLAGRK